MVSTQKEAIPMGIIRKTSRKSLAKKWKVIIDDYKQSGHTQSVYSTLHGFPTHQLRYWIKRLSIKSDNTIEKQENTFVPVRIEHSSDKGKPSINEEGRFITTPYCQLTFDDGGVISIENELGFSKLCKLLGSIPKC